MADSAACGRVPDRVPSLTSAGRYNRSVLLRTDRASRACYRTDGGQVVYGMPDSVVHARSPQDVADLLQIAQRDTQHDLVFAEAGSRSRSAENW